MSEFTNLAENFTQTSKDQGSRQAASALFDASFDERFSLNRKDNVDDAIKTLTDQGALPLVSFEYLNSENNKGQSNFEVISGYSDGNSVINRDELNEEIDRLEANDATFSIPLINEIKEHYDEVSGLDGESGISESDYKKFIKQQQDGVEEKPTLSTVQAGDGFDRIARRVYKEMFGENPSTANLLALSEHIAELNGNDRQYSKGQIHPGQELKLMSKSELEKFFKDREP